MSFRRINARYLEPASQSIMIAGIISLVQPWSLFLHEYGVAITLFGLLGFIVFTHIQPDQED